MPAGGAHHDRDVDEAITAAAEALGPLVTRDAPLGARTTYRVGGPAALLAEVADEESLERIAEAVAATGVPVIVIGNGSNLLVADAGFAGLAVALTGRYAEADIDGTTVVAGGAVLLPSLARRTVAAGLRGFEWAVGVPGSIGGAVRMNAGGHGSDMAAVLVAAEVCDLSTGAVADRPAADLRLGYRRSAIEPSEVVTSATIALEEGDATEAKALLDEVVRWRRENQPGGQNSGSVFTNPPGDSAGRLIDAAGLKGLRVGSAHVSEKHANFFQADRDGSADDVWSLIQEVQRRVADATGVELQPEVKRVGFES